MILILCLVAIAGLYYARTKAAEGAYHSAPSAAVAEKPDVEIFTGADSAQFSIYAPQYPGSSVIEASRFEDGAGTMMIASMTTPDKVSDVAEYYSNVLDEKGFEPDRTSNGSGLTAQISIAGARPSAGISVLVTIQSIPNNGTRIDLTDTTRTSTIP